MTQPDDPQRTEPPMGPVRQLRVRRSPRYAAFLGTGAVVGLIVALVSGATGPVDPQTGRAKLIGYLAMTLVLFGALVGAGVAVALERFSRRSRIDGGRQHGRPPRREPDGRPQRGQRTRSG